MNDRIPLREAVLQYLRTLGMVVVVVPTVSVLWAAVLLELQRTSGGILLLVGMPALLFGLPLSLLAAAKLLGLDADGRETRVVER